LGFYIKKRFRQNLFSIFKEIEIIFEFEKSSQHHKTFLLFLGGKSFAQDMQRNFVGWNGTF
jgi:hypothetical protein